MAFIIGLFALLASMAGAEGAIYMYVDEAGIPHFTDAPTKPYYRRLPAFGLPPGVNVASGPYADLITRVARGEGVDPDIVRAIIRAESNFQAYAISRKGAQGLMQLMPGTAGRYAVANPFDAEENIRGGVRYLRDLSAMFPGRLPLVLAAYNAGENAVLRYNGIPPYPETRAYVNRVLTFYSGGDGGGNGNGAVSAAPAFRNGASRALPSVPSVYRRIEPDGVPLYTNLPPLVLPSHDANR
jgi:soluble lytic murein transglycosylase